MATEARRRFVWIVAVLCLSYVLSHYFRASSGVIAPALLADLAIEPAALAPIALAFFLAGAAMQIPVGLMLDRVGARLTLYGLMLFTAGGSALFAVADSVALLIVARAMMGIGCAAAAMGAVAVFARWAPPDRMAAYSGILFGAGTAGGLLAASPLAAAAEAFGWRATFVVMAAATLAICLLGLLVVRDTPEPAAERRSEPFGELLRGLLEVMRTPVFWRIFAVALVNYPLAGTVVTLWGAPYLHDMHGLGQIAIGGVLLAMNVGLIAGYVAFGQLDRVFDSRKWLALGGLATLLVLNTLLALQPRLPVVAVTVILTLFGFASAFGSLLIAHTRSIFPPHLFGRAATLQNMGLFLGAVLWQGVTGLVATQFSTEGGRLPEEAYRAVFAVLAFGALAAIAAYATVADPKPSLDRTRQGISPSRRPS